MESIGTVDAFEQEREAEEARERVEKEAALHARQEQVRRDRTKRGAGAGVVVDKSCLLHEHPTYVHTHQQMTLPQYCTVVLNVF